MDIRFCDICNESIAQIHFDEGRAIVRADGVSCTASANARDEGRSTSPTTGDGGLWMAAIAILVAAGIGWLVVERAESAESAMAREGARRLALIEAALGDFSAVRSAEEDRAIQMEAALTTELESLRQAERDGRVRVEELAATTQSLLAELDERLSSLGTTLDGGVDSGQLDQLAAAVEGLRGDVEVLAGALVAELNSRPVASPEAADESANGTASPLLAGLADPDPLVRWNSVDQLARSGDADQALALLPMLTDPDILVRMSVARALGELGNPASIPALIEALGDTQPPVREASVVALRTLTSRNFRFDPLADDDDRERRIESWRSWWERGGSEEVSD